MILGFASSKKMIELQDELEIDAVMYAGDLCYAGLSGDLTPNNNVTEDDEFGHVSSFLRFNLINLRFGISGEFKMKELLHINLL